MTRRADLAEFLRARRAALSPEDVGIVPGARRRTQGLRREEVALLAGVSVSWYTWLEQGRPINASLDVLDSLARVLRLEGELRFYEHVDAEGTLGRRVLRGLDHAWPHLAGGCHVTRDTVAAIRAAGFEVGEVRRFQVGAGPLGLPHVLGTAVAPG